MFPKSGKTFWKRNQPWTWFSFSAVKIIAGCGGVVTKYPIPMSERIFCVMGDSGRKPVSRGSSTCTDASNLWPLSPMRPRWFATLHPSYKLYLVFPSLQVLKEMKETERRNRRAAWKNTNNSKKRKSLFSGLLRKKFGMAMYFLKFLNFNLSAAGNVQFFCKIRMVIERQLTDEYGTSTYHIRRNNGFLSVAIFQKRFEEFIINLLTCL